jgi:aerobic-type carbon monoxide dehydrogenase small subunit (CoxS/CutS family)
MDKLADGHGAQADLADIDWLDRLLKNASHCGLGSAAPNPVIDTLQKFRPAYERRLVSLDFEPAFDLDAALAEARQLTARDDPAPTCKTHEEEENDQAVSPRRPARALRGRPDHPRSRPQGRPLHPQPVLAQGFPPHGSCKLCVVKAAGRHVSACATPAKEGWEVESNTPEMNGERRGLLQMLFVEGNHFCPSCEKSGNCELQALAYEYEMLTRASATSSPTARWTPPTPTCCSTSTAASSASCACAPAASRRQVGVRPHRPRHRQAPGGQCRIRPAGRHRLLGTTGRPHLPGGRDPAQGPGFAVPIGERTFDVATIRSKTLKESS